MTVFDRVKELADSQGLSIGDVEEKVGMGKNSMYKWKKQKAATDKLELVADFFGVSVDYLLGRTDVKSPVKETLPTDLDEILDGMMSFDGKPMNEHDREAIRAYLEGRFSSK